MRLVTCFSCSLSASPFASFSHAPSAVRSTGGTSVPYKSICSIVSDGFSFLYVLNVVAAVEGHQPIFLCQNIKDKAYVDPQFAEYACENMGAPCLINGVMLEAEEQMRKYLREKTLAWLNDERGQVLRDRSRAYFARVNN
jgi:hypothetical protein